MTTTYRPEDDHPHVDTWICANCRKPLERGHRIIQVFISQGRGRDPKNIMREGLHMSDEFELAHYDCKRPFLRED